MQLPKGMMRRGRVYYVWTRVPSDVAEAFGSSFVRESMREYDPRKAIGAGHRRLAELNDQWQRLRQGGVEATPAHRHRAARELYENHLEHDELRRVTRPTDEAMRAARAEALRVPPELQTDLETATPEEASVAILGHTLDYIVMRDPSRGEDRTRLLTTLRRHLGCGRWSLVEPHADMTIERERLNIRPGSLPYNELCRDLLRAWIAALETEEARDQGNFGFTPADSIVTQHVEAPSAAPGESIMEMFDQYAAANPRQNTRDTIEYSRKCVELFAQSLPPGAPLAAIDKKAVRNWHDLLRKMPIKASETREFRGLSIRDVVKVNECVGKAVLSPKSINKYLSALASFCRWLESRDHIPVNPVRGFHDTIDKTEQKVLSYTSEELSVLFNSPLFTGFERESREHIPGRERANDWRFWLPLISLFTGARMGEIAQFLVADVREQDGHWLFHITREGWREKRIKTKAGTRIIPVHSELIRIGLLDLVAMMRGRGEMRLFPDLPADKNGHFSYKPSQWFGRYATRIGLKVKGDKSINFHSLRHTITDAWRRAGYLDEQFNFLLGHSNAKTATTRGYGVLPEGNLALRVELIGKVEFPGLDLSHLHQNRAVPTGARG